MENLSFENPTKAEEKPAETKALPQVEDMPEAGEMKAEFTVRRNIIEVGMSRETADALAERCRKKYAATVDVLYEIAAEKHFEEVIITPLGDSFRVYPGNESKKDTVFIPAEFLPRIENALRAIPECAETGLRFLIGHEREHGKSFALESVSATAAKGTKDGVVKRYEIESQTNLQVAIGTHETGERLLRTIAEHIIAMDIFYFGVENLETRYDIDEYIRENIRCLYNFLSPKAENEVAAYVEELRGEVLNKYDAYTREHMPEGANDPYLKLSRRKRLEDLNRQELKEGKLLTKELKKILKS